MNGINFINSGNGQFRPVMGQQLIRTCKGLELDVLGDNGYGQQQALLSKTRYIVLETAKGTRFTIKSSGAMSLQHQTDEAAKTFLASIEKGRQTRTIQFVKGEVVDLTVTESDEVADI